MLTTTINSEEKKFAIETEPGLQ